MSVTLTSKETLELFQLLDSIKITKCDTQTKLDLIKNLRLIKHIATSYQDYVKLVLEKAKGTNHEEIGKLYAQWRKEGENTTLSEEQKELVNNYIAKYQNEVNQLIAEEANKTHEIEFTILNEKQFCDLLDSNPGLETKQIMMLQDYLYY